MGGKSVLWAVFLVPVLTGCGTVHNLTTETCLAHTQRGIERDLRQDARAAWRCVRAEHPRRAFTDEFRDGFLDGYVDYLDRGGCAAPPAVPPIKYVKKKRYFTPEGHCLITDYYLGFKYGTDVAVASGKRQYLTVPVLLADGSCPADALPGCDTPTIPFIPAPPTSLPTPRPLLDPIKKKGSDDLPADPPKVPLPVAPKPGDPGSYAPPLPRSELPVIRPFNPDVPGDKFASPPPSPDLLPPPDPPVPEKPLVPLPVPRGSDSPPVVPSGLRIAVPTPPDAVPLLPPDVPTPSVLDDLPVLPFRHLDLTPLPFRHPQPGK